jgi:hypothetical protein
MGSLFLFIFIKIKKMDRQVIFGVYDKTTTNGSYIGYFKHEDGARKELANQMNFIKEQDGITDLVLKNDRVVKVDGRVEEIFFIIHPIMLR